MMNFDLVPKSLRGRASTFDFESWSSQEFEEKTHALLEVNREQDSVLSIECYLGVACKSQSRKASRLMEKRKIAYVNFWKKLVQPINGGTLRAHGLYDALARQHGAGAHEL